MIQCSPRFYNKERGPERSVLVPEVLCSYWYDLMLVLAIYFNFRSKWFITILIIAKKTVTSHELCGSAGTSLDRFKSSTARSQLSWTSNYYQQWTSIAIRLWAEVKCRSRPIPKVLFDQNSPGQWLDRSEGGVRVGKGGRSSLPRNIKPHTWLQCTNIRDRPHIT